MDLSVLFSSSVPVNSAAPAKSSSADGVKLIPQAQKIPSLLDTLPVAEEGKPLFFGGEHFPFDPAAAGDVGKEIEAILRSGHKVAVGCVSLPTLSGFMWNAETKFCTQSTIKAPYCGSVLEQYPGAPREHGDFLREALLYSSNEAYEALRRIYGPEPIDRWCLDVGLPTEKVAADYPRCFTVKDMLRLWSRLYVFLNDGSDKENYGTFLTHSLASAAGEYFRGICPVHAKAGWECGVSEDFYDPNAIPEPRFTDGDPTNDETGLNDTGVVYAPRGAYLFCIFTDIPYGIWPDHTDPNFLLPLTEAIYRLMGLSR